MDREASSLSPPSSGKHRRSPGDGPEETSPKRRRHHRHRHRHHRSSSRHRHRHGDEREMEEEVAEMAHVAAAASAAKPEDDEIEEGEILEEGGGVATSMDVERGSDAEPVSGALAAAPENAGDNADTNSNIDANELHDSRLAGDSFLKDDFSIKERNSDHGAHEPEGGLLIVGHGENHKGGESSQRKLRSPQSKGEKERKHKDVVVNNTKERASLSFSVFEKEFYAMQHGQDDEHHTGSSKDPYVRDQSRKSPHSRHHSEAHSKNCSRSSNANTETDSQANGSRATVRDDSGHESNDRCSDQDTYVARRRESVRGDYKERERSSSRIGRDGPSDKLHSRERYRDKRHCSDIVDEERVDLHEVSRRDRERSTSYSRSDRRESVHHGRDEGREREKQGSSTRHKDEERRRDASRDRYKAIERVDIGREREKFSDDRDRRRYRDKELDARRAREGRRRASSSDGHKDSMHSKYEMSDGHKARSRSREKGREAIHRSKRPEKMKENSSQEEDEEDYQEKIEQQLAKQEQDDPEKIKEEARKRKQAILEKYRQQQLQKQQLESVPRSDIKDGRPIDVDETAELKHVNSNGLIAKEEVEDNHELSNELVDETSLSVRKSPSQADVSANMGIFGNERTMGVLGLGEGTPKSERSADIFCDDIFGESPAGVRKLGKEDGLHIEKNAFHDNWDDAEGYYTYRLGEVLDGRYEVTAGHGKGVFSTVVRAKDLKAGKDDLEEVAIKIIRNNETMYKAGKQEVSILEKLARADPEDKRHCVRFISSFMYRNHLCLVFESLHMNLREVLKKFGRNIGLKLTAVRAYSKQLFIALKHLRNCRVLHCDIKPDNMLVNEAKNVLKLCDFGSAMLAGMNEVTPYLVSRFYRAPEIILGLPYDHPLDMWSVGCCLYELYTGKVLFPGPSNNDMLRLHMELKGPFPKKMLRKGAFTMQHFDQDLNFYATEEDPVTKKAMKRLLLNIKPKDIGSLISSFPGEDLKMLSSFKDLLEKIFVLDPEKRLTVSQALSHPFITGK